MAVGKSVLVIDDSELFRELILTHLSHITVGELREACNGQEGVDAYRASHSDLVLLDIEMPGMNGLTVLTKIREIDPSAFVVILSATSPRAFVLKALQQGARHYIRKDTPPDRLRTMLRQMLGDVD